MPIVGFIGNPRQGKTQCMIMREYGRYLKGKRVLSYKLKPTSNKFPFEMVTVNDIMSYNLEDCDLMLDEVHTLIDSRNPTQLSRLLSYFWTQSGKRDVNIVYTTQLDSMVDLRLRDLADYVFKSEKVYMINKLLKQKIIKGFRYYKITGTELKKPKFVPIEKARRYFDLYDSYQKIMPLELDASDSIDLEWIKKKFESVTNKRTFCSIVRGKYNFISYDNCGSVFDCLKNNLLEDALDILRIRIL